MATYRGRVEVCDATGLIRETARALLWSQVSPTGQARWEGRSRHRDRPSASGCSMPKPAARRSASAFLAGAAPLCCCRICRMASRHRCSAWAASQHRLTRGAPKGRTGAACSCWHSRVRPMDSAGVSPPRRVDRRLRPPSHRSPTKQQNRYPAPQTTRYAAGRGRAGPFLSRPPGP